MFKKILTTSIASLLLFFCFVPQIASQEPSEKPFEEFTSYELFWPIVAGKIPGDTLYPLKTLKARVNSLLTFSNSKKAEFHLLQSKKRLVEAEKLLLEKQDYSRAKDTISKSVQELEQAISFTKKAKEKNQSVIYTHPQIISDGTNEGKFLLLLAQKLPSDQQEPYLSAGNYILQILEEFKTI